MSRGFYALLGVEPTSSAGRIRSAYGQARARLAKLRRRRQEAGDDVAELDLEGARLREAWEVLSDPLRRRRYDALLAWEDSERPTAADRLWAQVGESLVHPAASVATRLLRVTSQLAELGDLPRPPSGAAIDPATLIPHDDDLTTPRVPDGSTPPRHRLRVVDGGARAVPGGPSSAGVIVLHQPARPSSSRPGPELSTAAPRPSEVELTPALPDDEVRILTDEHGYSGSLLRAVRERLGLTLRAVSEQTRISEAYLQAVEAEATDALPAKPFVRGYVREVSKLLHLDADAMVKAYMRRYPTS